MGNFFTAWATWEKLVFILGCTIVVTLLLGCAKLVYAHRKLRKYTVAAESEEEKQKMQRQMSQRRRTEGPEVPFGIRAIESGIEVEGVWISRNNSPEPPNSRDTSKSSVWGCLPRKDSSIDLEKQHSQYPRDYGNNEGRRMSNSRQHSISGPKSDIRASRDPSPNIAIIAKPKQSHPPPSLSKYIGDPVIRQTPVISAMEGIEAIHRASGSYHAKGDSSTGDSFGSSSARSTGDSTDSEPIAASAPGLLNHHEKQRQMSTDLDLMQNHRMSQAAEVGQLTPRVRRPGHSGEWASIANIPQSATTSDLGDYFGRQRTRSPSPAKDNSPTNGTLARNPLPKIDTLPAAVRRSSLPDVTPFTKFCQTAPSSPLTNSQRPASAGSKLSTKSAMQQVGDSLSLYMSAPSSPVRPITAPEEHCPESRLSQVTTIEQPEPKRSSFEKRASAVLRGHGTGFEILRPGTFGNVPPATDQIPEKLHKQAPPISLHNSIRANSSRPRSSSSGSERRKLQKKRRPSSDSDTSDDTRRGSHYSID